jgi:putative oxidoreductase
MNADTLIYVGRLALGLFFIIAGIRNFLRLSDRLKMETNYGWTLPAAATVLGFTVQLLGGVSVAFGLYPVWGASALIVFLILATTLFHNVLLFKGDALQPHLYFTLVNCTLVGHCLMVIGLSL